MMIRILAALALGAMTTLTMAESVTLTSAQMDSVTAGKLVVNETQTNGGGNTPKGDANGVPVVTTNTTKGNGNAPPGKN